MTSRSPALTADRLIVIGRGELIASMSVDDFVTQSSHNFVRVRTPEPEKLLGLLGSATSVSTDDDGAMRVVGLDCAVIGDLANANDIALHDLAPQSASLEEAFMGRCAPWSAAGSPLASSACWLWESARSSAGVPAPSSPARSCSSAATPDRGHGGGDG